MDNAIPDAQCVAAQLSLYRRAHGYRCSAVAGVLLVPVVAAALIAFPQTPLVLALIAVALAFVAYFSWRALRKSRIASAELHARVAREGNLYCCPCGRPTSRYYWLHYFLLIAAPAGWFALAFPLKRCRGCRRAFAA